AFMSVLCNNCGEICQREDLIETVARPRANFDNRHLDAVVSRLRRKLEEHINLTVPIKVVYGVGYTFTASVVVQ
ncbi:helix-turn-helix domain-containing protein, partial [Pseudomonas sp. SB113]